MKVGSMLQIIEYALKCLVIKPTLNTINCVKVDIVIMIF